MKQKFNLRLGLGGASNTRKRNRTKFSGRKLKLRENHVTFSSTQYMRDIGSPLKTLSVDMFSYSRFYFDGSTITLVTDTDWYAHFFEQEVPGSANVFGLKDGCNLWSELFPEESVWNAKKNFNIHNPIHFSFKNQDYVETVTFASKVNDPKTLALYISNIDLLEKFIEYFKKRAAPLIESAAQERFLVPEIMRGYQNFESSLTLGFENRKKFLDAIGFSNPIHLLTEKEFQCVELSALGMTAKEVGKTLTISPRTVETHIVSSKRKLGCNLRSQLLEMYWDYKAGTR